MAVSGTYAFNPKLAEQIDEAFERCGIDPADLVARHVRSAIRSANLVFSDWATFGYKQHTLEKASQTLTAGDVDFALPAGGYDIFHATLKREGYETEMYAISRQEYNALHDKDLQGRPDRYFVDRSTFTGANPASTIYLWQAPENSTDQIEYWYLRRQMDAGNPQDTLDMAPHFYEAFAAGMAYHLSVKFAPQRTQMLKDEYLGKGYDYRTHSIPGGALGRAIGHDGENADLVMRVRFDRGRR